MIVLYEPYASGYIHIEFDRALLLSVLTVDSQVIYYGEQKHIDLLRATPGTSLVTFRALPVPDYDKSTDRLGKFFAERKNLGRIRRETDGAPLIITNGMPQSILFANLLFRGKRVYFVMHGRLAALCDGVHYKPWNMQYYMKTALQHLSRSFRLILLGESIRQNAMALLPKVRDKMVAIDHPFLPKSVTASGSAQAADGVIRIATVGAGTFDKGITRLNGVAEYIAKQNLSIEISHIGKIDPRLNFVPDSRIQLPFHTDKMVAEQEYQEKLRQPDYFLYPYEAESYRLTASGALFEAFALKKPIIALRNDYFDHVLSKSEGKVGYLCADFDELLQTLHTLAPAGSEEYKRMQQNAEALLGQFSPAAVGRQLSGVLQDNRES